MGYSNIRINLTKKMLNDMIKDIKQEAFDCLETIKIYKREGLEGLPPPKSRYWYGQKDILFPCLNLEESIESCKERIKDIEIS